MIKQIVHPLASAVFVETQPRGPGYPPQKGEEKTVNSCSGDMVDVPIILKGTAPWNLELQVVGPTGVEKFEAKGIRNPNHTLKVKIPKDVDRDGGTMLVDLSMSCKTT